MRGPRVARYGATELAAPTLAALDAAAAVLAAAGAFVAEARHPSGGHELTIDVWRSYNSEMRAAELYGILRRRDAFRTAMLAFAERFDLILCRLRARPLHGAVSVAGELDPTSYTTPYSLTGWPAATVRCGSGPGGLPIGVQLVAGPWRDDVALAAAALLEREMGDLPGPQPA